jgi:hypothetical protein
MKYSGDQVGSQARHIKMQRKRRDRWSLEAAPSPSTPVHVSGVVARVMATRIRGGAGSAGGAGASGASASTCVGGIAPASRVASVVGATVGVATAGHGPLLMTSDDRVFSPVGSCGTARDPVRSLETEVDPLPLFGIPLETLLENRDLNVEKTLCMVVSLVSFN